MRFARAWNRRFDFDDLMAEDALGPRAADPSGNDLIAEKLASVRFPRPDRVRDSSPRIIPKDALA